MGPFNNNVMLKLPFFDPQYAYTPTHDTSTHLFKGALMQIWKSLYMFVYV